MDNNFERKILELQHDIKELDSLADEMTKIAGTYNNNLKKVNDRFINLKTQIIDSQKENIQAEGIVIDYATFSQALNVLMLAAKCNLCNEELPNKILDMARNQTKKDQSESINNEPHKCSCNGNCSHKEQPKEQPKEQSKITKSKVDMEEIATNGEQFIVNLLDEMGKAFGKENLGKQIAEEVRKNLNN